MINHIYIAKNLKSNSIDKSIMVYKKDIKKYVNNNTSAKSYLNSLNTFLYTYFLVKYNKDLISLSTSYEKKIKNESNILNLIDLGEIILNGYTNSFSSSINFSDHEIIEEALNYINKNFVNKITLQIVADKLHISKNYLCHLFKRETGYKFCEYINLQRVNKAKKLILENKKNLEFISYECGFSSQSHFSTTFKKYTRLTPNQFKKNKSH
ncbi:MAG: helix-turn-helix domain-containing protein [Peptoniphilaceae bacterium]